MTKHHVFTKKTQLDYYLDKRYLLQNNKFALKIKIYDPNNQKNFYLKTKYEFNESESSKIEEILENDNEDEISYN